MIRDQRHQAGEFLLDPLIRCKADIETQTIAIARRFGKPGADPDIKLCLLGGLAEGPGIDPKVTKISPSIIN